MIEKATTNRRRSLFDLADEHLRAVVAGDIARAHECEDAARPWSLYPCELHVDAAGAVGVMLTQSRTAARRALPPLSASESDADHRFVAMDAPAALELGREERLTVEAVQRVIDALDRSAEWEQLAAVFDWLAKRRTELRQGLDDKRPAEIAALPAGSFEHWKPYDAHGVRDDAVTHYLQSVGRANAAWLAERQQDARRRGPTAAPREGSTVSTKDTGRLVDAVRNIGHVLNDLDEIAADRGQTALDVLRMADEDEPRAVGLDDQLLTLCRLLVDRWSD